MPFTVPTSFPELNVDFSVYPGEIARAGSDTSATESVKAVGLADRITRARRLPVLLEAHWDTPMEYLGGPGAGVANWATVVDFAPFSVPARSTGTLDVVAWCKDCESSGGVYVAVYADDLSTLVDDLTLTNTTSGTIESRTGQLTGLTPGNIVYLVCRIASSAAPTAARLYSLLVTDVDLADTDL